MKCDALDAHSCGFREPIQKKKKERASGIALPLFVNVEGISSLVCGITFRKLIDCRMKYTLLRSDGRSKTSQGTWRRLRILCDVPRKIAHFQPQLAPVQVMTNRDCIVRVLMLRFSAVFTVFASLYACIAHTKFCSILLPSPGL